MYKPKVSTKIKYETVAVFSTKSGEDKTAVLIEKVKNLISSSSKLDSVEDWGTRKLIYQIDKETEGRYVLFNFTSDSSFPAELDRVYKITEGILRSLISNRVSRLPPRKVREERKETQEELESESSKNQISDLKLSDLKSDDRREQREIFARSLESKLETKRELQGEEEL